MSVTRSALCLLVGYALVAGALPAQDQDLAQRLSEIDSQRNGLMTDTTRLVDECLALLTPSSSSEDKGRVYAQIALIYAQSGLTEPDKVIEFCERALENELDVVTRARMHVFWADALHSQHRDPGQSGFAAGRREIAAVSLRGLKVIQDQNVPETRQELPLVQPFDSDGIEGTPEHEELIRQQELELAAREEAMAQNTLVSYRDALVEKIRALYSQPPPAEDELSSLALDVLQDEKAVAALMQKVAPES